MSSDSGPSLRAPAMPDSLALWLRRFLIVLTVLGLIAIGWVILRLLALIVVPLTLFLIAALLAYIAYPAVAWLKRYMPQALAIVLVGVTAIVVLALIAYSVLASLFHELARLADALTLLLRTGNFGWLNTFDISPSSLQASGIHLVPLLQTVAVNGLALSGNVFVLAVQVVLVATLTVYFLIDGARLFTWMRQRPPLRWREPIAFFLAATHRVLGGFLRGVIILACLMSLLSGAAALVLGIPFWLIIAIVVFVCEFIPLLGAYIAGFIGTLLALTQGWQTGLIYLIFATVLQGFLNAEILAPRIIGKATGLNPIISTFALVVGISLFGITGAVIAIPVAAVAQIILFAAWTTYRHEHPEEFPDERGRTRDEEPHVQVEAGARRQVADAVDSQTDGAAGYGGESQRQALT